MLYNNVLVSILEVVLVVIPVLLVVAFVTLSERKTMASMQRRLGPNFVGYYGLLQAFADALKLLLKEYVSPTQANLLLFFLGPVINLIFSLYGFAVLPFGYSLNILDFNLGVLYLLAVSSLATYGILLAGWSANSKYAFLGSLRSTAQLISYELIISSCLLVIVYLTASLNLTNIIESQKGSWFIFPLLPIFLIFYIGSIAETNRAPFDLAEAESELVSGFMTEHASVVFVFFFLAEYASIVLICTLTSIILLGGYLIPDVIIQIIKLAYFLFYYLYGILYWIFSYNNLLDNDINYYNNLYCLNDIIKIFTSITIGVKSSILIFTFIWVRASFPRIRFDQLMSYCWTELLPELIGFIILIPCLLYSFLIIPCNINIF